MMFQINLTQLIILKKSEILIFRSQLTNDNFKKKFLCSVANYIIIPSNSESSNITIII